MPTEELEQSYYPSAKLRLIIRFEEFGNAAPVEAKAPSRKKLVPQLLGKRATRGALEVTLDPAAPPGVARFLVGPASAKAQGGPQQQDKSADDLTHTLGAIVPGEAKWGANGIMKGDELKATLKFIDCPIDPRCIRSCGVEFYLGTVTSDEFARGIDGEVRQSFAGASSDGDPLNVAPDTYLDPHGQQRTNLRFEGFVDEWEVEWPEDGEPCIHLECRDNTKLFIDQDASPGLVVDEKLPIDQAVATYLTNYPRFAGISVEYRPGGVEVPKLGPALAGTAFKPKLGYAPKKGGGFADGTALSVWDYLVDVCGALGHIVRVEGTVVVVQRARDVLSSQLQNRTDDPFIPRLLESGLEAPRRLFLYGRNVTSYKVARRFGRGTPQNVEVRCYSPKRKKVMVERFPQQSQSMVTDVDPGDGHSERKVLVIRVAGIEDRKVLRAIAQSNYEVVGRNELMVSIKTRNLATFGGDNEDPDLLDVKAGDSFDLLVNRDDDGSTLTNVENAMLIHASAEEFLKAAGFDPAFAAAYARAYSDANFQTSFRVKCFAMSWSCDEGISIDVDGVNYLEVRADRYLPQGEERDPAAVAGSKTSKQTQPVNQ